MEETSYNTVWILTLFFYLILIIIFLQTTCFLKRSCLKQLSDDRQHPVAFNHFGSTVKRAVFIIQVGFLEVCAGLVVIMEATAVKFDIVRNQPGREHCSEFYQYAGQLHYVSCAIVGCLFLSIIRCLAQRYVLQRQWKSDVVSMTRIYLVPATCFVTALSVWSWFRLYKNDPERKQSDKIVCCHVVHSSPSNSLWLILVPIFWNLLIDYLEHRAGEMEFTAKLIGCETSAVDDGFESNNTSLKETNLVSEIVLSQQHPSHSVLKTTSPISNNDEEIANNKTALSADTTLLAIKTKTAIGVQQFTDKAPERSVFDSLRDFLNIYTRIYLALVIYLAAMIGVYTFLSNCHAFSELDDFMHVVFMALLVTIGLLRALQVTVAEVEHKLKCEKICEMNV